MKNADTIASEASSSAMAELTADVVMPDAARLGSRILRKIRRVAISHLRKVRQAPALFLSDMVSACLSLVCAFVTRYGVDTLWTNPELAKVLLVASPQYLAVCAIAFPLCGLYSRNWRYGSITDLWVIVRAVGVATLFLVCALFFATRLQSIPRSTLAFEALLLLTFLAASRLIFRWDELPLPRSSALFRRRDGQRKIPTLLVGAGDAADLYLRALSRDRTCTYWPVGLIEKDAVHQYMRLRNIPILGGIADFANIITELKAEGTSPRNLIFTEPPAAFGEDVSTRLIAAAEAIGMTVSRLSQMTELRNAKNVSRFELRSIELNDLLDRPQARLDRQAIHRLIKGRRVLVTGAGGSIGCELTLQIAACEPAEIVLVENCEFNLYAIDMELSERYPALKRTACLCNVRRAARVNEVFDQRRPELVFHAAALKHVPMVELNPCEGALTNIIGTMNVANAARNFGAIAMVQVSTDKVVNPTSVMGATKRLAELYCQALDLHGFKSGIGPRFMTVRFGNVLGSSGSLIPLFKRQIAAGGPLTVTDAEMTRFFMTIREAVELTLQASSYGLEGKIGKGEIFVLDMGDPIKIIDIAKRMIRLAGYEPDKDIAIKIIGLRPGEKRYEELFDTSEVQIGSPVPGVFGAVPQSIELSKLSRTFSRIERFAEIGDEGLVLALMSTLIPGYVKQKPAVITLGDALAGDISGEASALEHSLLADALFRASLNGLAAGDSGDPGGTLKLKH